MAHRVAKLDQKTDVPICFLPPRDSIIFVFVIQEEDAQSVKKETKSVLRLRFTLLGWRKRYILVHKNQLKWKVLQLTTRTAF